MRTSLKLNEPVMRTAQRPMKAACLQVLNGYFDARCLLITCQWRNRDY